VIGAWYALSTYWGLIMGVPAPGFATPPVVTDQQYFNILASFPGASTIFYSMYSLVDLLVVPATLALYLALKEVNKNALLVATGMVAVWAVIDLGVTEFNSLSLISLAQSYNSATDATQRAAFLAAGDYALAAIPIATFYSYFIGSLGFLIASLVMLRGVFRRGVALLGVTCNALGIVCAFVFFNPSDLSALIFPTLNVYGLWNILVGAQLIRLGRRAS
jgi:hypothetical protein